MSEHDVRSQLQAAVQQVQAQFMVASGQIMMDKCFQKCVTRPGSSLTGSEKSCLMNCRTAFSETLQIVQERVAKKLQEDTKRMAGGMH